MTRLRMAIVGAGRLGRIHARLATTLPDVELAAVVDPDTAARESVASELGVPTFARHTDIPGTLDGAIVAAPTASHFVLGRELLLRNVHVFMEKPITPAAAEGQQLVALARQRGRILQVGHVERFNPAFAAARAQCAEPCYIEAVRTSGYTCRSTDVGVVLDLMIHDLDLVLALVPSPLRAVHAVGATVFGPFEDMAQARLSFANGCVANLTASRTSPTPQRTMHLYHRAGCISIDFAAKQATATSPSPALREGIDIHKASEAEREHIRTHLFEDYLPRQPLAVHETNAIQEEQREFVNCIRTGRDPEVSGEAGCRAVEAAEWIQEEIAAYMAALHRPATLPIAPHRPPLAAPQPRRQAG